LRPLVHLCEINFPLQSAPQSSLLVYPRLSLTSKPVFSLGVKRIRKASERLMRREALKNVKIQHNTSSTGSTPLPPLRPHSPPPLPHPLPPLPFTPTPSLPFQSSPLHPLSQPPLLPPLPPIFPLPPLPLSHPLLLPPFILRPPFFFNVDYILNTTRKNGECRKAA